MIPVNTPIFRGNELKYLSECIESGWISSEGPFITRFENEFANYIGQEFGVAVSNGSAALDISIKALGLTTGDEVIMPTSKAILVVHIYGLPVDMDPVLELCRKYGLLLIEDAAEMHGQTYKGKMCGSFGDISIFSFYPNKHITTGEGGMILCSDTTIFEKSKKLRNLAFEPNGRRFVHNEIGWNYRMTNLQAALGVAQLENIDFHVERKRQIGELYFRRLSGISKLQLPEKSTSFAENIYWIFGLVADSEIIGVNIVNKLSKLGIGTRPFFWCMHEQPVFNEMGFFRDEKYPIAERIARNGFYLPSGLGLSDHDINFVSDTLIDVVNNL